LGRPLLLLNPLSDTAFVAFAQQCAVDAVAPEDLQARLRTKYAAAVVRLRSIEGEQIAVWYVYRDGRWRPEG